MAKRIVKIVESVWQGEGRGARVRRSIGRPELRNLDPFLMLDEFGLKCKDGGGFPDHPHRGFETVTYLLEGEFFHEDFTGRKGNLKPGDVQWMTAGRGIVHSEIPGNLDSRGLQLWVNLQKKFKMVEPVYQEMTSDSIKRVTKDGITAKIVAGESMGVKSPIVTRTPTYFIHFSFEPNTGAHRQLIPSGWTTLCYTLAGKFKFGSDQAVPAHHTALFSREEETLIIENDLTETAELVLIAGQPINEPIARQGPFVMNTQEELHQAFEDYQECKNGFEHASTWKSIKGNA